MKTTTMKNFLLGVLAFFLTGGYVFGQCADTANIYGFTYNGKIYEIIMEEQSWAEAAACAVERGGYLFEINDSSEQNAVYDTLVNGAGVSPTYTTVMDGGGIAYVWTGATDQDDEGVWIWDGNNDSNGVNFWNGEGQAGSGGGSAVGGAYVNWGGTSTGTYNEPDDYGAGQDHAAIALAGWPAGTTTLGVEGEWNDIDGTNMLYYIVEYDSIINSIGNYENGKRNGLNVYPNPAEEMIVIKTNEQDFTRIELYDMSGRRVLRDEFSADKTINVSELNGGVYVLKVYGKTSAAQQKVIIK